MKVKFTRDLTIVPKWNGNDELPAADQIKITAKPFTTAQFFSILDDLDASLKDEGGASADGVVDIEKVKARFASIGKLTVSSREVMIDRVTKIEGLTDDSGTALGVIDVLDHVYFFGLASEVLMSILDQSRPNEDEVKN